MRLCCFNLKKMQLLILLLAAAVLLGILMILFFFNYPSMVKERIINQLILKNNTEAIERFRTTKDIKNLHLSFNLFNVTNSDEVVNSNGSVKIKLQEVGPIVYKELKIREFINNNQTSGLISYKQRIIYILDKETSIGDPSKLNIIWPNVPLLVAQDILDSLSFFKKTAAYLVINKAISDMNEPPFIQDTAENFILKGSKRNLFEHLQNLDILKIFKPWPLKDNMFALLYGRNNTWDYNKDFIWTSSAGFGLNQSYRDLNRYVYANGSTILPYWQKQPPSCNKVDGTDGQFFQPFLNRSQPLEIYSIDTCRKMKMKYAQDYTFDGINVYKYLLDSKALMSGMSNPENKCFCLSYSPDGVPASECNIDGIFDMRTCNNPNIFGSGAHFFRGDPNLLKRIDGVSPAVENIHEPVVYVEPNTGLTVKVKAPLQINIRMVMNNFKIFNFFQDPQSLIIPLVWIEEAAELTDDQASMLKSKLLLLDSWFVSMVLGGSIIFVLVISVIGAILCVRYKDSRAARLEAAADPTETTPILDASSESRSYTNVNVDEITNNEQ